MLQRKLLARLGLLVAGFIAGAVVSIALLQGVLRDLDAMNADAAVMIDGLRTVGAEIESIESEGYAARTEPDRLALGAHAVRLREALENVGLHPVMRAPAGVGAASYRRACELTPAFVARFAGTDGAPEPSLESVTRATELRHEVGELTRLARQHVANAQLELSRRLRLIIIGLTIAALVMVNITIVVLLRTATMILRPVGALVEASRQLARERFEWRVRLDQEDEFAELARAYNHLAGELAANEKRKVEALHHLAVTLNHELNNVITTIGLQLALVDRRSGGDPALGTQLRSIHENLGRVSRTIASLRNVRRVVLTDYGQGEKMLDLPRSVEAEEPAPVTGTGARP